MMSKLKFWWNEHHEKTHNIFAGIHYLIIAIAIICGGIWAVFTFNALNKAETAEIEYSELIKRIKNTESSTIDIKTDLIDYDKIKGLIVEVTITNNGKDKLYYPLNDSPLTIYKVKSQGTKLASDKSIRPKLYSGLSENKSEGPNEYLTCVALLSNSIKTLSYFIPIEDLGVYYITFISQAISADKEGNRCGKQNDTENITKIQSDDVRWFASKYVSIK